MIKKFKIFTFILTICLINVSCGSVKKAFDPERKNSSEEFLVEKKSPLSMPPDFDKLPVPKTNDEIEPKSDDIKSLITENDKDQKTETEISDKGVTQFILDKINNN